MKKLIIAFSILLGLIITFWTVPKILERVFTAEVSVYEILKDGGISNIEEIKSIKSAVLLSRLEDWKKELGEPETVKQLDNGKTFFYWPQKGIAIFTHPQYEAQYEKLRENKRKVTSVIIPLNKEIKPIVPVEEGTFAKFENILNLNTEKREVKQNKEKFIELRSSNYSVSLRMYENFIEVREDNFFSWYD